MKKWLLALLTLSSPLFAGELASFKAITEHLENGNEIVVVVHDALCKMYDPNEYKIPVSTMVTKPTALLFTENLLGFDGVKFTSAHPSFPRGALQRASFVLHDSGDVNISIAFYDVESNKKSSSVEDVKIRCRLGEGVNVYQR